MRICSVVDFVLIIQGLFHMYLLSSVLNWTNNTMDRCFKCRDANLQSLNQNKHNKTCMYLLGSHCPGLNEGLGV